MFTCVLGFENLRFLLCILGSASRNGPTMKTPRCISTRAITASETRNKSCSRRDAMLLVLGVSGLSMSYLPAAYAAGLPPEDKPRLCEAECEKELENVWWDHNTKLTFWTFHRIFLSSWHCQLTLPLDSLAGFDWIKVPMVTTESGLQYKDIKVGKGPSPPVGYQVKNWINLDETLLPGPVLRFWRL